MKPKKSVDSPDLFRSCLDQILNRQHPLFKLADRIDWQELESAYDNLYHPTTGRPGIPTRLMAGLHYLKHAFSLGDETVLAAFLENPYYQYFCGFEYFQHQLPIDPTSMVKWRKRIGP